MLMLPQPDGMVLDRAECLRLLATGTHGRVIYTDRALPAVQPVYFAVDGDQVIFRVRDGSTLAAGTGANGIIAFEIDNFDVGEARWWSITVIGSPFLITDPAEFARLSALLRPDPAPKGTSHLIILRTNHVQGWRPHHDDPRRLS